MEAKHASSPGDFQDTGNQMNNLHEKRFKNANRSTIGHLNVISLRNKFEILDKLIKGKIDIFLISETKLGNSFPSGKFIIKGCSTPFRLERNQNWGGLLLYVGEDIPCKILKES